MLDNNNNLIIIKNSIFKKVINFFLKIFNLEKNSFKENCNEESESAESLSTEEENIFLKEGALDILNNSEYYNNFIEHDFKVDLNYDEEKEKVFNVYKNIKNGKVNIEKINSMTLIQLNQMLKTEIELKVSNKKVN